MIRAGGKTAARRGPLPAAARLLAFLLWTAAIGAAWLPVLPWLGPRRRAAWAAKYTRAYARGTLRILGIRLRVHGRPAPRPAFLAANHLGYLDVMAIAAALPCAFVAKSEIATWPLFGALAAWSGTLFVDRNSRADVLRVNRLIRGRLAEGGTLALFPEGTSTDGRTVAPFRSSLLETPASLGVPVHYAALRYRAPADAPAAARCMCWWGDMEFLPHFLALFRLRGLEASLAFGAAPIVDGDRKSLAGRLAQGVQERARYLASLEAGRPAGRAAPRRLRAVAA